MHDLCDYVMFLMHFHTLLIIFRTNLLMVARVHKFLFLYFMCRNYLDKEKNQKKKPCRSWTLTLQKYVPTRQVLKIVLKTLEEGLKRKNLKQQSCRDFFFR